MDPTLAKVDAVPTATFLTLVGNSSAVYRYAMANVILMRNLPTMATATAGQMAAGGRKAWTPASQN